MAGCVMELPIVAPTPVISDHAVIFRDLFENQCQFRHFQHYLTELIILPSKSIASITRYILENVDKTHLSRFFAATPWQVHGLAQHPVTKDIGRIESSVTTATLNRSAEDWYTHAATMACSSAALCSMAAVTAGS